MTYKSAMQRCSHEKPKLEPKKEINAMRKTLKKLLKKFSFSAKKVLKTLPSQPRLKNPGIILCHSILLNN